MSSTDAPRPRDLERPDQERPATGAGAPDDRQGAVSHVPPISPQSSGELPATLIGRVNSRGLEGELTDEITRKQPPAAPTAECPLAWKPEASSGDAGR
jgi:hypothetical protein